MSKTKKVLMLCLIISVAINVVVLVYLYKERDEVQVVDDYNQAEQKYPLLSKRVLQEYPQDLLVNFLDLRKKLHAEADPNDESFGVYFEYLPTGTSISINANNEFYAASLFKVPVIMAYYHELERTNQTDDPVLTIKKEDLDNQFGNLWKKGEGYQIKSSEAIKLALAESDNTAAKAIADQVDDGDFQAVYDSLDVDLHADKEGALVSAKNYSSVLKALFLSSVLSKDSSEQILDYLSQSQFNDKLVAGIPRGVPVSHKIGDFNKDGHMGFRDCGIVYVPRRPYILCMYSVGNEQTARSKMKNVSKTVYDYVSKSEVVSGPQQP